MKIASSMATRIQLQFRSSRVWFRVCSIRRGPGCSASMFVYLHGLGELLFFYLVLPVIVVYSHWNRKMSNVKQFAHPSPSEWYAGPKQLIFKPQTVVTICRRSRTQPRSQALSSHGPGGAVRWKSLGTRLEQNRRFWARYFTDCQSWLWRRSLPHLIAYWGCANERNSGLTMSFLRQASGPMNAGMSQSDLFCNKPVNKTSCNGDCLRVSQGTKRQHAESETHVLH